MEPILQELDREWSRAGHFAPSAPSAHPLSRHQRHLAGNRDRGAVLVSRRDPARSVQVLNALAPLAPTGRHRRWTLLQAMMPRIVRVG